MQKSIIFALTILSLTATSSVANAKDLDKKAFENADVACNKLKISYKLFRYIKNEGEPEVKTEEICERQYDTSNNWNMLLKLTTFGEGDKVAFQSDQKFYFEKGDHAIVNEKEKTTTVRTGKAYFQDKNYEWLGLTNGPCLALGRGLSKLSDVTIKRSGNTTIVTGVAPDSSLIEAKFEANSVLPSSILRTFKGIDAKIEWTFSGQIVSNDGSVFPKRVVSKTINAALGVRAEYEFKSVSNDPQTVIANPPSWLVPKYSIVDQRFTPSMGINHDDVKDVKTLEELKVFASGKSKQYQTAIAKGEKLIQADESSKQKNIAMIALPIILLGTGLGAFSLSKALRRQANK